MKPVFVGMPPKKTKAPEVIKAVPQNRQKGLLFRIAEIINDDVRYYLYGIKSVDRQKWEDYERFCELARRK